MASHGAFSDDAALWIRSARAESEGAWRGARLPTSPGGARMCPPHDHEERAARGAQCSPWGSHWGTALNKPPSTKPIWYTSSEPSATLAMPVLTASTR
jgi:hypothetical protein